MNLKLDTTDTDGGCMYVLPDRDSINTGNLLLASLLYPHKTPPDDIKKVWYWAAQHTGAAEILHFHEDWNEIMKVRRVMFDMQVDEFHLDKSSDKYEQMWMPVQGFETNLHDIDIVGCWMFAVEFAYRNSIGWQKQEENAEDWSNG